MKLSALITTNSSIHLYNEKSLWQTIIKQINICYLPFCGQWTLVSWFHLYLDKILVQSGTDWSRIPWRLLRGKPAAKKKNRGCHLEWFSFAYRKVLGFAPATLHDWLKTLAPLLKPIKSKTKANHDSLAGQNFPRFASATCNYFGIWLVHCIVSVLCDWRE